VPRAKEITDPHLIGELAAIHGLAAPLADYLRKQPDPAPEILKSVSRYLSGDDDSWQLYFTTRTGRPPAKAGRASSLWEAGQENSLAHSLFALGEKLTESPGWVSGHQDAKEFILALAAVLDPKGSSKWKLVYRRLRAGNPGTRSTKEMKLIFLGLTALQFKTQFKTWGAAHDELCRLGLTDPSPSARIKAVEFVRSLQNNMGPETLQQLTIIARRNPRN